MILPSQKGVVEIKEIPKKMTKMIKDKEQLLHEKHLKLQCPGAREKGFIAHCPLHYNWKASHEVSRQQVQNKWNDMVLHSVRSSFVKLIAPDDIDAKIVRRLKKKLGKFTEEMSVKG